MARELTQKELADELGLSSRQVHNLASQRAIATVTRKGKTLYPWPRVLHEYITWKIQAEVERRTSKEKGEEAERRKSLADAELAELKVAAMRARYITLEAYEQELRRVLGRVRAKIVAMPGEYAPRLLGMTTMPQSVAVLRTFVNTLLAELATAPTSVGDPGEPDVDEDPS